MDEYPDKDYYKIGEVAQILGVNASTLRFWEKAFGGYIKPVKRNNKRLYRRESLETLKLIKFLLKDEKYTIEGARQKLKYQRKQIKEKQQIIEDLEKLKSFLKQLKNQLSKADPKG